MATSCRYEFQLKHFGFADIPADDFYRSQWFKSKAIFVAYRAVLLVYCLFWAIYNAFIYLPHYPQIYVFLSYWGEWCLVVHFAIGFGVSLYGLVRDSRCAEASAEEGCCPSNPCNRGDLRWFHHLSMVVQSGVMGVSIIVSVVYWSMLSHIRVVSVAGNVHEHIMNVVLMVLDLFMSRVPVRFLHFIYMSLCGLTYVLFTLILHGADVRSTYYENILDWANSPGLTVGVCLGLCLIGAFIVHSINFGLYHLRALIARSCGCASPEVAKDDDARPKTDMDNQAFEMTNDAE